MKSMLSACAVLCWLVAPAQAQSAAEPFRIGLFSDMDGLYTDTAGRGSVVATQMAIEDFGGVVLGRKIELMIANDQNKPDIGGAIVRKWYEVDRVEAVIAAGNSAVSLAAQNIARDRDKVLLHAGPGVSDITGKACARYSTHWAYDTYSAATSTGLHLSKQSPGSSWYFLTADYAFGTALERDTSRVVAANGGKIAGGVRVPLNTSDFSSFLLQAQGAGAGTIALAVAGADLTNAIKQAHEFRVTKRGPNLRRCSPSLPM